LHKICELYKNIYVLSGKIPKKDKFGIWLKIENICLETMNLIIAAAFETKTNKLSSLNSVRIKIEALKRLLRIAYELNILESKKYINLELDLQEISKMTNGWIKYLG
jgi:four helix bundle protein